MTEKVNLRRVKVITLGSNASGKSCLIKRFCEERFVSKYIPTIGVDYGVKAVKVRDSLIRVNFWVLITRHSSYSSAYRLLLCLGLVWTSGVYRYTK